MTVLEQRAYEAIASMAKKDEPDYWTKLEHQYAGMAMQGILAHEGTEFRNYIPQEAKDIAHALVEKLKKKEENNE
jgi:hypothetical protein